MDIAFVVARRMAGQGGMETVVSNVVKNWQYTTDKVTLIVSSKVGNPAIWLEGVNYIKLSFQAWLFGYPFLILHLFWTLCRLQPDVIIAGDSKAVRYCCWYRDFFNKNAIVVCWIHSSLNPKNMYRINNADIYMCVSKGIAREFKDFGIPPKKIEVVYNAVESADTIKRSKTANFIYLGRIVMKREKRTDDFIKALSRLNGHWSATIIGDGKDLPKLKELAKKLDVYEKINWLGWQEKPWEKVVEASCLVLTSEMESFGMVLGEAMMRGLPCISTNALYGPVEIVKEGVNGWFYPVGDNLALAKIMQKIVDSPLDLPDEKIIRQSIDKYSSENIVARMQKICLEKYNNN